MNEDEQAIRELVARWMQASRANDLATVLSLMTDDIVFQVPGREPLGKKEFEAASRGMSATKMEGTAEIVELKVIGDWAWMRNRIQITVTSADGAAMHKSGYTLSVLLKENGRWLLARDANLVT